MAIFQDPDGEAPSPDDIKFDLGIMPMELRAESRGNAITNSIKCVLALDASSNDEEIVR